MQRAVELEAADGGRLRGTWAAPEGPGPFAAVLCIHGLTLDQSLFAEAAGVFAAAGLATLRLDLRGHGASDGDLKDQGFLDQLDDLRRSFEGLRRLPDADPARCGLLGFSMGAAMAALQAGRLDGLRALALWSPLLRTGPWNQSRQSQYGPPQGGYQPIWDGILVNERLFSEAVDLDPMAAAEAWTGPFFLCHGGKDRNHPQARSVELADARQAKGLPVASYFPPLSGHRYHHAPERATRDALSAAFFSASLA